MIHQANNVLKPPAIVIVASNGLRVEPRLVGTLGQLGRLGPLVFDVLGDLAGVHPGHPQHAQQGRTEDRRRDREEDSAVPPGQLGQHGDVHHGHGYSTQKRRETECRPVKQASNTQNWRQDLCCLPRTCSRRKLLLGRDMLLCPLPSCHLGQALKALWAASAAPLAPGLRRSCA